MVGDPPNVKGVIEVILEPVAKRPLILSLKFAPLMVDDRMVALHQARRAIRAA
jgi:hypothetical protein